MQPTKHLNFFFLLIISIALKILSNALSLSVKPLLLLPALKGKDLDHFFSLDHFPLLIIFGTYYFSFSVGYI